MGSDTLNIFHNWKKQWLRSFSEISYTLAMVTCSYPSLFILLKYRSTYVLNKNKIGNFGRKYRETMEN